MTEKYFLSASELQNAKRLQQLHLAREQEASARKKIKTPTFWEKIGSDFIEMKNSAGHRFFITQKGIFRMMGFCSGKLRLDEIKNGRGTETSFYPDTRYTDIYKKISNY